MDYTKRLRENQYLSDSELLSVIIQGPYASSIAADLLRQCDSIADMARLSLEELQKIDGVGAQTAVRIKACLEFSMRLRRNQTDQKTISSPADAATLVMHEMEILEQEEVWIILLDTRNRLVAIDKVYKGSLNMSMIRVGELFKECIRRNTAAVIMVHNHPSGDPSPSPDDVAVTKMVVEAGKLLDILLYDHIIIGANRFVSMKERGLGFS